jgi:hypothetical protein
MRKARGGRRVHKKKTNVSWKNELDEFKSHLSNNLTQKFIFIWLMNEILALQIFLGQLSTVSDY